MKAVEEGHSSVNNNSSQICNGCGSSSIDDSIIFQCSGCKTVKYCNSKCQKGHWKEHKVLCNAIKSLHEDSVNRCKKACEFVSHFTPKQRNKIVNLVGERCLIDCCIDDREVTVLWDTGSQVCLVGLDWLKQNGITKRVLDLAGIVGRSLEIEGVGGNQIPYEGYVMLSFKLNDHVIEVPFLVTKEHIRSPIIGYNVISSLVDRKEDKRNITTVKKILQRSKQDIDDQTVSGFIASLQASASERLSSVNVLKKGIVVKAGSIQTLSCKIESLVVDERTPVVFEPEVDELLPDGIQFHSSLLHLRKGVNTRVSVSVINNTDKDVILHGRLQIGEIQLVTSVTPVQVEEMKGNVNKVEVGAVGIRKDVDEDEKIDKTDILWETINEMDMSMLTVEETRKARQMLWENRKAFAFNSNDIGNAEDLKLELKTFDEQPVQRTYSNIPRPLMNEVKSYIEDLLNRNWITRSNSSWSSPMVLVRKKDGSLRLCCDFRRLNKKTVPDKHPLPRVQASLDSLGGNKWFSVLDQSRAYYQGYVSEEDRHKTAFITPWGLYQWVRIPFGLTNAPATFQRYMEETVHDFRDKFAIPYLDDVIVYSGSFDDHLLHLEKVLQKCIERGLKLNLKKCKFFESSVKFLGRIVSADGYRMDDDSIKAAVALKGFVPKNVSDVRHILGLLGYHRRHIQNFSSRAKPISELLIKSRNEQENKLMKISWSEECQLAMESLIDDITSPPILAYPDFEKEFILHTDASGHGLGAILYQKQDGLMRVI